MPVVESVTGSALVADAIEHYAPPIQVPTPTMMTQARRNIELRVALLTEFGAVETSELLQLLAETSRNPSSMLDNWRRAHKVVIVSYRDTRYVPGFLLLPDGTPDPAVRPVIDSLKQQGASDWECALWFTSMHDALQARPVDLLLDSRHPGADRTLLIERLVTASRYPTEWF